MQEVFAIVFLSILGIGFLYSAINPHPLIRITNWSNSLIRWDWPTDKDTNIIRILAGLACIACVAGFISLIRQG